MGAMEPDELILLVRLNPDYIKSPKYGNSLAEYLAKVDKIPDSKAIARLLMITPQEVEAEYDAAVQALRRRIRS